MEFVAVEGKIYNYMLWDKGDKTKKRPLIILLHGAGERGSSVEELPVVIVSGPRDIRAESSRKRRDIVEQTFKNAVAAGDKNVYFVDGLHFYDQEGMPAIPRDYTTVDKVHPTDLGFHLMYRRILPVLKKALGIVDRA